jgi:hypothetical protein
MLPFSYKLQRIFYRSSENELGVDHILMYEPLRPSAPCSPGSYDGIGSRALLV